MSNIAHFLQRSADLYPHKTAVVCNDHRISYQNLLTNAARVAQGLASLGVQPGDRIALSCHNVPQFLMVYYGALYAGAVVVPVNILLRANEVLIS